MKFGSKLVGSLALGMVGTVTAATLAMAANSGSLNVVRDGNSTTGGTYNFLYEQVNSQWRTRVAGTFKVTEPTARLDARVDGYAYGQVIKRTSAGSSTYSRVMWGDTIYADSVSLRVCYVGVLWDDCTSKTVYR